MTTETTPIPKAVSGLLEASRQLPLDQQEFLTKVGEALDADLPVELALSLTARVAGYEYQAVFANVATTKATCGEVYLRWGRLIVDDLLQVLPAVLVQVLKVWGAKA